jgi:myb proto-oncogene protein
MSGFQFSPSYFGNKGDASPWNQSLCTGSTCTAMDQQSQFHEKLEEENGDDSEATKEIRNLSNIFNSDCVVWDLPAEDLINPMV